MRPLRFVVSAIVLLTAPAQAQVVAPPPKGIILPNYDMVRIGQTEAIESGAVVARASGPLANVYNPAGLAASDKTEINGSSTGYQLVHLGLEGIGQDVSSSRLANLGGFLGAVFANPVIKSKSWRLGFSIYSPWDGSRAHSPVQRRPWRQGSSSTSTTARRSASRRPSRRSLPASACPRRCA